MRDIINDLQRIADRKCYPKDILDGSIAQYWVDILEDNEHEIERLNNIINELKKYINVNLFCYCEEDLSVFEDLKEDILNIINEDNKPYKLELEEWGEDNE